MNTAIKIAFFDIDGTLTSNSMLHKETIKRIPASAKETIKKLQQNGIITMIATGRGKLSIVSLVDYLEINDYIASNGLSIVYQGEEIVKQYLLHEQIEDILSTIVGTLDMSIYLETSKGDVLVQESSNPIFCRPHYIGDIRDDISKCKEYDTYQITIDGSSKLSIDFPGLKARVVGKNAMDIYPENLSKASAIEHVLKMLSLSKEQAIAFGDEENDLEMFHMVGTAVAMGNAIDKLKSIASYVTDTVDNDGIYKACLHYQLIQE